MAEITTPAAGTTAPAKAATVAPAAAEPPAQTLPQIAADARAAAVRSLQKILDELPEPGDSGDFHLAGTRGQLKSFIDQINLFPVNA